MVMDVLDVQVRGPEIMGEKGPDKYRHQQGDEVQEETDMIEKELLFELKKDSKIPEV